MFQMFSVGDEFSSYSELATRISKFKESSFLQLYARQSRTIEAPSKRATKKHFSKELEYSELGFACIHGGKDGYKSTSTGKRPNQW